MSYYRIIQSYAKPSEDLLKIVFNTCNIIVNYLKIELGIMNIVFNQKYDNNSASDKLKSKIEYIRQ